MAGLKEIIEVETLAVPEQVGRTICIIPTYIDSYENLDMVKVFIPVSQVTEIHTNAVKMPYWVAEQKGLV